MGEEKEFWILKDAIGNTQDFLTWEPTRHTIVDFVHVIEKSSYVELEHIIKNRDETIAELRKTIGLERDSLSKSRELVGRLEEALKFYADVNTWIKQTKDDKGNLVSWTPKHPDNDVSIIPYSIGSSNGNFHCKGKIARAALELIGGKKNATGK